MTDMKFERTDLAPSYANQKKQPNDDPWPVGYICPECNSTKINFEGWIYWDAEAQDFAVSNVCDKHHTCEDCEHPITPVKVYLCRSCYQPEQDCSNKPCEAVQADRT